MYVYVSYRGENIPWHWLFRSGSGGHKVRVACKLPVGRTVVLGSAREDYHAVYLGCPECRRMLEWSRLNKAITQEDFYRGCVG